MKDRPKFDRNTPEEEAAINRGIALDPDTYEMTDEEFERCWGVKPVDADAQTSELAEPVKSFDPKAPDKKAADEG